MVVFTKLQQLPGGSACRFFGQKSAKLRKSDAEEGADKPGLLTNLGRSFDVRVPCLHASVTPDSFWPGQ